MNISYYNLVLEITRRCNMKCAHCMRGEAQNIDIPFEVIDKALENVSSIGCLTLTGGEISLNPAAISYVAQQIIKRGINVDNVYMVTHGKLVTSDFLMTCVELFSIASDGEFNGLALSTDQFHEPVSWHNINMLRILAPFSDTDKDVDWESVSLINLGKARELTSYQKRDAVHFDPEFEIYDDELCFTEGNICVTVHGDILKDCDYEYCNTDHLKIGSVFDPDWAQKLVDQEKDIRENWTNHLIDPTQVA